VAEVPGSRDVFDRIAPAGSGLPSEAGEIRFRGAVPALPLHRPREPRARGSTVRLRVIEEPTATTLLPPGWTAEVGPAGALGPGKGASRMTATFDQASFNIVSHGLHAVAQEMGEMLVRSAYSTIIREARDCSTSLLDREGRIVAQAQFCPIHMNSFGMVFDAFRGVTTSTRSGPARGS
jgi:hypothetical protein